MTGREVGKPRWLGTTIVAVPHLSSPGLPGRSSTPWLLGRDDAADDLRITTAVVMGPCFRRDDALKACSHFKQPETLEVVIASHSEAIRRTAERKNGLLRRFAPRNDGWKHTFAFSRH